MIVYIEGKELEDIPTDKQGNPLKTMGRAVGKKFIYYYEVDIDIDRDMIPTAIDSDNIVWMESLSEYVIDEVEAAGYDIPENPYLSVVFNSLFIQSKNIG